MRNLQYEMRICQKSHSKVTKPVYVWFELLWIRHYIQNPKKTENHWSYSFISTWFFRSVGPTDGESRTVKNNMPIDLVVATGNCCWEIESNNGDYETVNPTNPNLDVSNYTSSFHIQNIIVYNSCPYWLEHIKFIKKLEEND